MKANVDPIDRQKLYYSQKSRRRPSRSNNESSDIPPIMQCLFDEHRHLAGLVGVLDRKATQGENLQRGDYYLLRDIVGYLHDYPDEVHHPTENRLLEILVRRVPSRKDDVDWLKKDHLAVARETQALMNLLDEAIEVPSAGREQAVRKGCRAFAVHQRAHMQFENSEMFPAALEALTVDDFKQIESWFAAVDDPLFGDLVGKRYRLLHEYLLNPAEKVSAKLAGSRFLSLDRLILTVDVLEDGVGVSTRRILDLARDLVEESRSALDSSMHPKSIVGAIGLPAKFALTVGRSVVDCNVDLLRIYRNTLGKGVKSLFT